MTASPHGDAPARSPAEIDLLRRGAIMGRFALNGSRDLEAEVEQWAAKLFPYPAAPARPDPADAPRPGRTMLERGEMPDTAEVLLSEYENALCLANDETHPVGTFPVEELRLARGAVLTALRAAVAPPASQPDAIELAAFTMFAAFEINGEPEGSLSEVVRRWLALPHDGPPEGERATALRIANRHAAALGSRGGATAAPAEAVTADSQCEGCRMGLLFYDGTHYMGCTASLAALMRPPAEPTQEGAQ